MSFFKDSTKLAISSVPIARALTQDSMIEGIDTALMDTFGVSAGVAMMFFNVLQDKDTDAPEIRVGKMYGTMIAGMAAGMFVYNVAKAAVIAAKKCKETSVPEEERLLVNDALSQELRV